MITEEGKKFICCLQWNYFNDIINIISSQIPLKKLLALTGRAAIKGYQHMEQQNLYRIKPPGQDRPPEAVAREIVHLIRTQFPYNTASLCHLLHCDRQWIDQHIRPEVEHIFVTHYFRQYMVRTLPQLFQEGEMDLLTHGFYFYSAKSLQDFWNTHASAERKTIVMELAKYRRPGVSKADLRSEYLYHQAARPCQKEAQRHREKMEKLVSAEGLALYSRSREKKVWTSCKLPVLNKSLKLVTAAEYRRRNGLHSNASAMNHLFQKGAVRIKLGSRALWIVPEKTYLFPVALQAPDDAESYASENA